MTSIERLSRPRFAFLLVITVAITQYAVWTITVLTGGPDFILGGDFVAFWSAARETLAGNLVDLYTPDGVDAAIQKHLPDIELTGLTWQYPPHASLIFSPIGYFPFMLAYALWCGLGLTVFTSVLISIGLKGRFLLAVMAMTPVMIALINGQNALFTGSLLLVAVFYAKPKPILAGLAAGLLTIKPQLGILLPVFFLASGHWRAFLVAAIVSIMLCGWSYLVVGAEGWTAFFTFLAVVSDSVSTGIMPLYKMVNVYSAARLAWLPEIMVLALAGLTLAASICAIVWTSRKTDDARWHYAVLATMTLLTTPYSMYYELALIVPAMAFVVLHGAQTRWLSWERESIAVLMLISVILPGPETRVGVSLGFIICLAVCVIVLRRLHSVATASTPALTHTP
jgi:hypothetical protein